MVSYSNILQRKKIRNIPLKNQICATFKEVLNNFNKSDDDDIILSKKL